MIIVFLLLLIIYLISTYIMFIFISKRFKKDRLMVMHKAIMKALEPYDKEIKCGYNWISDKINNNFTSDIFIRSDDNIKLHGLYIRSESNKKIIIFAHGYRSTVQTDLFASCKYYYEMGYNLLLIDQRGTGKSDGKYITFGVKESEDIICWCKYINKRYKKMSIILGGISMGATSVLMASKYSNIYNVKAVIADSPFVFPYDQVLYCIKHYFYINGKYFIDMINVWCMIFAKFSLKEKNVILSLKDNNIPILLIHGEDDDFVPLINSKKIYDNYRGIKYFVTFPGASHGMSFLVDSKRYINEIKSFLNGKK